MVQDSGTGPNVTNIFICTYILVQVLQQLKGFIKSTAVLTKGVPVVQDSGTGPNVTNILFVHIY